MTSVMALEGVHVRFGGTHALQGVSLALRDGVTGLLGRNGAGKTTVLRVASGVVRPSSGVIRFRGEAVTTRADWRAVRARLGVLPQHFGYFPRFTVQETVEYCAWLRRIDSKAVPRLAQEAVARVGLQDKFRHRMGTLSGGMAQRVGIACAMVGDPAVVLLDEPSGGLDIEQRVLFREIVTQLPRDQVTLISSHLAEDIAAVCDYVLVLDRGRIRFDGTVASLCGRDGGDRVNGPDLERAYLATITSPVSTSS